jgi:starvation-inducible DNA-binding protein
MAIANSAHLPAFREHERMEVGTQLQATLVELIDLSLLGKQLHWTIVGPNFRSLHLYLDELIESWRDSADTVAERSVAVGFWPDGQADVIAAESEIKRVERGAIQDHLLLQALVERVAAVAERTRERMNRLGEIDSASEDVLIGVVRDLEMQLWMIRSQLPENG